MKKTFVALVLGALLTIPCVLRAEEVEIQLMEVISMQPLPGDNPLDDPEQQILIPLVQEVSERRLTVTHCPS